MTSIVGENDLTSAFEVFSVRFRDHDVIDKLVELCSVYRLDADDICDAWIALNMGKNEVTLTSLDKLETEELQKRTVKVKKPVASRQSTPVLFDSPTVSVKTEDDYGLFDTYTPVGKANLQRPSFKTPDSSKKRKHTQGGLTGGLSPLMSTPSQKYSIRGSKGEVVVKFGDSGSSQWAGSNPWNCKVEPLDAECVLKTKYKYMFQKLTERAHILNDMIEEMSQHLQDKYQIEELSHIAIPLQEKVSVVGRICCDSVGKLNPQSVLLEGSVETSAGKRVPLRLTEVSHYSLFPGQIVALEGINSTGSQMVASKIHEGVSPPHPSGTDTSLSNHGSLHVVIAAGPFTTSDCMSYEPLKDLCKMLQEKSPDICVMLGPFIDCNQEQISSGNLPDTFQEIFFSLMKELLKETEGTGMQLVVLPSLRDAHHDFVYPQPPFDDLPHRTNFPGYDRLHFVSEPSTFVVNGIVFGATSTDVLLHLGKEEISGPATTGDRLGRLMKHFFTQRSFYPVHPPPEDVPIDYAHYEEYARLSVKPHIFVAPSDMRYFVKDIDGSLCVNPGRLAKGQGGGTYAEILVQPGMKEDTSVIGRSAARIVRI